PRRNFRLCTGSAQWADRLILRRAGPSRTGFGPPQPGDSLPVRIAILSAVGVLLLATGCGGTRTVTKTVTAQVPAAAGGGATPGETFQRIPQGVRLVAPSIVTIVVQTP